jgi:hypothetical protein
MRENNARRRKDHRGFAITLTSPHIVTKKGCCGAFNDITKVGVVLL